MDRPGERLKRVRERLKLTYRDVEHASQAIAGRRGSDEFAIALSRLADIENKGTVPTIYRLYTLCAVYRLDLDEVLRWYGVPRELLASDALQLQLPHTHEIRFHRQETVPDPAPAEPEIDLAKTRILNPVVRNLGRIPLHFPGALEGRQLRYGLIGLEDWSMYPVLQPGSLVVVDETRRKIAASGWSSEFDRPIYFLEHRKGHACGWCALSDGQLVLQPHPASQQKPETFAYPSGIEVLGQVIGVSMLIEPRRRRHVTGPAAPGASPNP